MSQKIGIIVAVLVLLVLALGGAYFYTKQGASMSEGTKTTPQVTQETRGAGAASSSQKAITQKTMDTEQTKTPEVVHGALISTSLGDIEVVFGEATAPKTVANFVSLAATKFYDGIKFHRVINGFMIQAGDPFSKDDSKQAYWGTGGPGYQFEDELSGKEVYSYGTLAMANSGKNTNGSQFFIVSANPSVPLPPSYTVFGKVVAGMDVVERIQNVPTDRSNDRPLQAVVIKSVTLK